MNKSLAFLLLCIGLIVPQLFITEYWLVLTIWIITGFLLKGKFKRIFLTVLIIQLFVGTVLFFLWSAEPSGFLHGIPVAFDLPGFLLPLFTTLFNSLNAAFCMLAGALIAQIVQGKKFASEINI
jgi:hypothetical protein